MGPKGAKTYRRAFVGAVLAVALGLAACGGGDDDDAAASAGSSGSLNLSGATSSGGSSTGATASGGSDGEGVPTTAGAGAEGVTVAGSASGGTSASGGNGSYLHCASAADCKQYGGGKVCCEQGTMLFCTKPSACAGKTLP